MKKKIRMIWMAAVLAGCLTACTQADSGNGAAAGGASAGGTGTITGGGVSGSQTVTADEAPVNTEAAAVDEDLSGGQTAETNPQTDAPLEEEENYPDDLPDAQDEDETGLLEEPGSDEGWAGTYLGEEGETLTVSVDDSSTLSFSFANAGISGKAQLDGSQAVYYGDDHHQVVFEYAGTEITVTVVSEEDFDTSGSPVNGVYVRQ